MDTEHTMKEHISHIKKKCLEFTDVRILFGNIHEREGKEEVGYELELNLWQYFNSCFEAEGSMFK